MKSRAPKKRIEFPEWFRLARKQANMSQKELAELLDVTPQTIANWESGRSEPRWNPTQAYLISLNLNTGIQAIADVFQYGLEIDLREFRV